MSLLAFPSSISYFSSTHTYLYSSCTKLLVIPVVKCIVSCFHEFAYLTCFCILFPPSGMFFNPTVYLIDFSCLITLLDCHSQQAFPTPPWYSDLIVVKQLKTRCNPSTVHSNQCIPLFALTLTF